MVEAGTPLAAEKDALELIVRGAALTEVLAGLCRSAEAMIAGARCVVQLAQQAVGAGGTGDAEPGSDGAGREHAVTMVSPGDGRELGRLLLRWSAPHTATEAELQVGARLAEVAALAVARKRMETQLLTANRLASVGTLAAGVAHEINNPLAFILGNVSFLRARLADLAALPGADGLVRDLREMDEALTDCGEGARRIESIVRDLRAFSRSAEEQPAAVELKRVLEFAVRMVFNEVRHRARLRRDFEQAPIALADEGRLVQVVVSLLSHAAQSMPERSSDENEVTLSAGTDGDDAIIEVRDNGVGIAPEQLVRVFDPFFGAQLGGVAGTSIPAGGGASHTAGAATSGLGLAISHGMVSSMNGRLSVHSTLGGGTRFTVRLPLAPPAQDSQHAASGPGGAGTPPLNDAPRRDAGSLVASALPVASGRRQRLLVIDDETLVGASIRRLVGQRFDVVHIEDARAALELCRREAFDVVLCDLMMPALTGMELHAELELIRPALARRTGFITGGAFTDRARAFASQHATRCLEKPFNVETVLALIERLVA